MSLPVYMDSVGTILAAALLTPIYALIVAVLTSLLGGLLIHPAFPFYAGTQVLIALICVFAVRQGWFDSWWKALLTGILIAVSASIASAPVTVLVFGGVTLSGATAINAVLLAAGKNLWESVLAGSLVVESMDKITTALLAWVLLSRLPKRLLPRRNPRNA
jgi:energy-coupling factor transport system substrate-specific component